MMLGARLAEKENDRANALGTFLDNNVHNNFLAVGMGEQQRLEIERLRHELDNVTRERTSLKRRLTCSNDLHYMEAAKTRHDQRNLERRLIHSGLSQRQLDEVLRYTNEVDRRMRFSLRIVRNSMSDEEMERHRRFERHLPG